MKNLESSIFIGWVLLAIAIIMDDVTSHILFSMGFEVMETNPIFQIVKSTWVLGLILLCVYVFIGWGWHESITKFRRKYKNKEKYYKFYDIFVFIAAFVVMFLVVMKVSIGITNITTMVEYSSPEGKEKYDNAIKIVQDLKMNDPGKYQDLMKQEYQNRGLRVSYLHMLLIMLGSYLLFRIGVRVIPSDYD